MAQVTLDPGTSQVLSTLDTMFTQLYNLRELVTTPSYTGSTPKLVIDSSFNFGWRITAPSAWGAAYCVHEFANGCSVNAFTGALASIAFGSNNYYNGTNYIYKITAAAANYQQQSGIHYWYVAPSGTAGGTITFIQAMALDNNGNLLVGTGGTNPGVQVSPTGAATFGNSAAATGFAFNTFARSGTTIGSITQSGTTAVLYNTTSDERLKDNIADATDAGALIDSVKVRQYDWKADGSHQRYGFIAQELVSVVPEAVHTPADPADMMAVDYSKLVPLLVKEVQSLRQRLSAAHL